MKSIFEYLNDKVELSFKTEVDDLITERTADGHTIKGIKLKGGQELFCRQTVVIYPR